MSLLWWEKRPDARANATIHDTTMTTDAWKQTLNTALRTARPVLRAAFKAARMALAAAWYVARPILKLSFEVLLAVVIVFEEWGWQPLSALLGRIAYLKPIAAFEGWVRGLPPYGALAVFALPSLCLFPLKLLALFLIATGHKLMAGLLFIAAKVFGTAIIARLFHVTHDQLMRIGWFKSGYERLMPWKEALVERVRQSSVWKQGRVFKHKLKQALAPLVAQLKARVRAWFAIKRARPD
jgi:hypothetical protein